MLRTLALGLALALSCTRGPAEVEARPNPLPTLAEPRAVTSLPASAPPQARAEDAGPSLAGEAAPPAPPGTPEAPKPEASAKGRVRVSILARGELLRSEQRALDGLKTALARRVTLELGEATEDERTFAVAHLDEAAAPSLPAAWSAFETVIVLEVLAPRGVKPSRFSRGLGGVLIVRPPRVAPIFVERVEGEVGTPLGDDTLPVSLRDALSLAEDPA